MEIELNTNPHATRKLLRTQRQLAAISAVRKVYALGIVIFLVILAANWANNELIMLIGFQLLSVSVGGCIIWAYGLKHPEVGTMALAVSFGIICLLGIIRFGPNMGVGFLGFAWIMTMAILTGLGWLSVILMAGTTLVLGWLNLNGWMQHWELQFALNDWLRMTTAVVVVSSAGVSVVNRITREVEAAWHRAAVVTAERGEFERSLMQAQRLEGIGRLAGGVAHDFNNSLAVLLLGIETLRLTKSEEEREEMLKNMEQAARGAEATTRQLLSLSKQGSELGHPAHPEKALGDLLPNLNRLFPENIRIVTSFEETSPVSLSSGELEQVVLNLCLNARDAMPKGGEIRITCIEQNERVVIQVRDSGAGMDTATAEQATTAFFSTKGSGTGLGLAMVQQSVHSVGGKIEIQSCPGEGTTVTLDLPTVSVPESDETQVRALGANQHALTRAPLECKLLFLEDNNELREIYTKLLSFSGYKITEVTNVAGALSKLADQEFDVLLTDAMLPDGDSSAVIKTFQNSGWKPVLLFSGYIDSEDLLEGLDKSEYRYLQKPFSTDKLLNTLHELLEENRN